MWEREGGGEGGRVGECVLKFIFWLMTDLRFNPSCCQILSMILMICNVNIPVEKRERGGGGGKGGGIVSQARYVTAACSKEYKGSFCDEEYESSIEVKSEETHTHTGQRTRTSRAQTMPYRKYNVMVMVYVTAARKIYFKVYNIKKYKSSKHKGLR